VAATAEGRAPEAEEQPAPARRWRRHREPLALALFSVLFGLMLAHFSLTSWTHNYDEDIYKTAGVVTWHNLPSALWNMQIADRGLQRLANWTLGFGPVYFGTPDGFKISRLIDLAIFVTTAIPMYLWVKALGLSRAWSAAAGALSIAVPWAIVTTTFMTENIAYPASVWAMYAIWRAGVRPRPVPVILALVAIFVACLARAVMMLLLPVLVFVVVACFARYGIAPLWRKRSRLKLWHVLPIGVLVAGLGILIVLYETNPVFVDELTGAYHPELNITWSAVPKLAKVDLARVISGIGILPGIVAVAFIGRSLWRPARPESFALAMLAIAMLLFVDYGWMRAGPDERYMMYLAPPLIACAAVGVARREVGRVGLGLAALGVVILFAFVTWNQAQGGYSFFLGPAEAFHARILILGLGSRLPDIGLSYDLLLALGILAVTALLGFVLWRPARMGRQALVVGAVLATGLTLTQVGQAFYPARHFTRETAYGPTDLAGRSWIDRAVGGHDGVGFFTMRTGADYTFSDVWREAAFWNMTVTDMFPTPDSPNLASYGRKVDGVTIDPNTGHVDVVGGGRSLPPNIVEWQLTPTAPLVGTQITKSGYLPMAVTRISEPARLAWLVTGDDNESWTVSTGKTKIRVFKDTPGPRCLDVTVLAPPALATEREVRIGPRTVHVSHGEQQVLKAVPLRGGPASHYADLTVNVKGITKFPGGYLRGVRIDKIARTACG
jgi:hypothetical protein